LAWYNDGAIAAKLLPEDARPHVILIQTSAPFDVIPARLSADDLRLGRALYRRLLGRYLECQAADWWPGISPEILELELPGWAAGANDETHDEEW
jgi:hypothetical protein